MNSNYMYFRVCLICVLYILYNRAVVLPTIIIFDLHDHTFNVDSTLTLH